MIQTVKNIVEEFDFNQIKDNESFSDVIYQEWLKKFNVGEHTYIFKIKSSQVFLP